MVTKQRCQAKNPATCWKHGTGVGFDTNRAIQQQFKTFPVPTNSLVPYSLKRLESVDLAHHILQITKTFPQVDEEKVRKALLLASDLHKTDTRSTRLHHEKTPYIEHPLRNTLRLIRYGVKNETVIIGSLLHDTVEDHPFEIARLAGVDTDDEQTARKAAFAYISRKFSPEVSEMVKGMSNPINEDKFLLWQTKNQNYKVHVEEAIENPHVFLGKVSDYIDNALSLDHTEAAMSPTGLYRKASKYLLVSQALRGRLLSGLAHGDIPIPDESLAKIYTQLVKGDKMLMRIKEQYSPV